MIKLLIGGSPCTYWSIAQKNGRETEAEGMGWELFKNYLIAKQKFKPDFFLYENNKSAAQPIKDQISKELGVDLMHINSALVSAQNRQRFYAFNWTVDQPEDRGIVLRDILENADDLTSYVLDADSLQKHYPNNSTRVGRIVSGDKNKEHDSQQYRVYNTDGKSVTLCSSNGSLGKMTGLYTIRLGDVGSNAQAHRVYSSEGKSVTINAGGGGQGGKTGLYFCPINATYGIISAAVPICHTVPQMVRVRKYTCGIDAFQTLLRQSKTDSKLTDKQIAEQLGRPQTEVEHWFRTDTYFNVPDESVWFDLKRLLNIQTTEFDDFVTVFEVREGVFEKSDRCYDVNGKMSTLTTGKTDNIIAPSGGKEKVIYEVKDGFITIKDKKYPIKLEDGYYIIRKLTVKECCRLQTMPDDYCRAVSNAQAYKGLGNGWTAEVIIHILNGVLKDVPRDEEIVVLSMYDGIGTGRYCLDKMGFTNVRYYAYEIDKYAKQVAMSNYPDIIQLGDAFDVRHPDWTVGY